MKTHAHLIAGVWQEMVNPSTGNWTGNLVTIQLRPFSINDDIVCPGNPDEDFIAKCAKAMVQ